MQLILWLGFFIHRSPRFAGTLTGGLLAVSAALLMTIPPLLYSAAKRIPSFRERIKKRISIGTLLTWHVYTSIVGAILAILHTGHKFESPLGIWLTAIMMVTVLSGFIGRYYLSFSSTELSEKKDLLNLLATEYNRLLNETTEQSRHEIRYAASHGLLTKAFNSFVGTEDPVTTGNTPASVRALRLAESISDVEYAIKTHELLKRRTAGWLKVHIITSIAFYLVLIVHICSAVYFGIRWFQ